ncbi:CoB--CoM heterodisulfide reductase subunit B [Methanosphaera cuniculi]|uniref:CoB--CoM heterodisulfide reductase subunit B n=1 Tax=Methanosphaera cuniculi TaxID=1077256 RepID=UPI0026EC81AA|nr:CoB--CoM heterodisulfide reductase subunit B [Methanosphaera cuniculi]
MAYAYFLGCIMNNRYPGIEKATRVLFETLGVELNDMEGASCCPAPGVFGSFDKETWATIAARNITIAEDMGEQLLTECNGCFGSLHEANLELKEDSELREKVNGSLKDIGREYKGSTQVRHFAEVLYDDIGLEKIKESFKKELNLNVAVHYGCHFLKPSDQVQIDNPKNPKILDELVEITGAKSVPYKDKMMCCGAGGGVRARDLEVTTSFTHEKLENMSAVDVDAIIDVCPFCHMQFDVGQVEVNEQYDTNYAIPVLHLAQLYGLAMGLSPADLTLDKQVVNPEQLIAKMDTPREE